MEVSPRRVRVLTTSAGSMIKYQAAMSKAVWRPAFGRKMGFLVAQDEHLLGLIFLATPVIRMKPRDVHLFVSDEARKREMNHYMDMSVCVGAQPLAWHWNLGKMLALIAPTLGNFVEARYGDALWGITTTSLWGRGSQYNRIYKYLGKTQGFGHEHISDDVLAALKARAKADGYRQDPSLPIGHPAARRGDIEQRLLPMSRWQKGVGGDGSNPRMRMINFLWKVYPDEKLPQGLKHGQQRGIYYHPAVNPAARLEVLQAWYERWGLPRFERKRNDTPPYTGGLE